MSTTITAKVAAEVAHHEGLVLQAYKDTKGIWTAFLGVTSASGHSVERYIGNPQTVERALQVSMWLMENKYLPAVLRAFAGFDLTEAQLAAALSFHYNTGGIGRASWVRSWKKGKHAQARKEIMNWRSPKEIIPRREAERDLFFDGKWSQTGHVNVYPVSGNHTPRITKGKRVKIDFDALVRHTPVRQPDPSSPSQRPTKTKADALVDEVDAYDESGHKVDPPEYKRDSQPKGSSMQGKKTYIAAAAAIFTAVAGYITGEITLSAAVELGFTALIGAFIRSGVTTEAAKK